MSKLFSVGVGLAVLLAWGGESAFAQRDAARLGIQKPYYGSSGGSRGGSSGSYRNYSRPAPSFAQPAPRFSTPVSPVTPSVQPAPLAYSAPAYRSYSFEPIAIQPGDVVTVQRNNARLMHGQTVVGSAPAGTTFEVTKVRDGWVGAVLDLNGREVKGWIWNGDVRAADLDQPAPPPGE